MELTRRLVIGAGIVAVGGTSLAVQFPGRPGLNLRDFGAAGDGRNDDGPALRRALTALAERGGELHIPAGNFLIEDRSIARGASPYRIPPSTVVVGQGPSSCLLFRRSVGSAFYGLTIDGSDIAIRDVALMVDTAGGGWTAAVGIVAAARNLSFERIAFAGVGGRTGHYGILPIGADLDTLIVADCSFRTLDLGFSRQTTDTADYRRLRFVNCLADDCTEVFEFNAPGLSRATTEAGSPLLVDMTDDDGSPLPARLRPGQVIRSAAFPADTRVVAVEGRSVRVNRLAIVTSPPGRAARISAGRCAQGEVRNLRCTNIGQWAVGMANCEDWDIEVSGRDVQYELVHLEDGCRNIRVTVDGARCNLSPGVVGSPKADNGMVHASTGCRDVTVRFANADLTQNRGSLVNALCLQPGVMGTTGLLRATANVTVSGRILLRQGTRAVTAYETDIHFDGLELRNPDPGSRSGPMLRLPGCRLSGTLAVLNPGQLLEAGYGATGAFDAVRTLSR